jgi:hypothetical protein
MSAPGSRYEHDDLARELAEVIGEVWVEVGEERRDGYRELARHLRRTVEELREGVYDALEIVEDEDRDVVDALLDLLVALDGFAPAKLLVPPVVAA